MGVKKRLIWSLISLLLAVLSIWAVISQSKQWSISEIIASLRHANMFWLTAAVISAFLFVFFEGAALCILLRSVGEPRSLTRSMLYSTSDVYFSAITPSATGGQPVSALFMIRDGINTGMATAVLVVNLIMYTLSILLLGAGAVFIDLVFDHAAFSGLSALSKALVFIGFVVFAGLAVSFYMLIRRSRLLFTLAEKFYGLLYRFGAIKSLERRLSRLEKHEKDFKDCAEIMQGKTKVILKAFACNLMQRISQIAVPAFLSMAIGEKFITAARVFTAQCLVTIGYNYVPIPGAIGISDYMMLDAMANLVGREEAFRLEMTSRGLSFYLCVAASGIITLVGYIMLSRRACKKEN